MPKLTGLDSVIDAIRTAWYSGRKIVPIVGAGLSVDSGIPVVASIVQYFGKFNTYLKTRSYLPPDPEYKDRDPLEDLADRYSRFPWTFVQNFGWPDLFDLNQDMMDHNEIHGLIRNTSSGRFIEKSVGISLDDLTKSINPKAWVSHKKLANTIRVMITESILARKRDMRGRSGDAASGIDEMALKQLITLRRDIIKRIYRDGSNSVRWDMAGDWKKLIQHFTNYQGDYADALFTRFCTGRSPSLGHRYLAFMLKLLGVRTIFTYNFDELIEQALEQEGVHARVFAMEHGEGMPHDTLIRDHVSVIKLHGSNHALLVDERLDHPLNQEYKARFDRLVGINPLLLVVGCSGADYRLRDLVLHVMRQNIIQDRHAQLAWLHFESEPPAFLDILNSELHGGNRASESSARSPMVVAALTNNPSASLQHCYSAIAGRHPASMTRYSSHIDKPYPIGVLRRQYDPFVLQLHNDYERITDNMLFRVVHSLSDDAGEISCDVKNDTILVRTASEALLHVANRMQRDGYHVVWVDLESVHTLSAIVGSIIDQCRLHDPSLSPSVLPLDDNAQVIGRFDTKTTDDKRTGMDSGDATLRIALRRIRHALRRGRYLVVFDGYFEYLWAATAHHGVTTLGADDDADRLRRLNALLKDLSAAPDDDAPSISSSIGESRVILGVDPYKPRTLDSDAQIPERIEKLVRDVVGLDGGAYSIHDAEYIKINHCIVGLKRFDNDPKEVHIDEIIQTIKFKKTNSSESNHIPDSSAMWAMILLNLSAIRRSRHLASLRYLLRPILGNREMVDKVLLHLVNSEEGRQLGLRRLEGGAIWFGRQARDHIYSLNSNYTSAAAFKANIVSEHPDKSKYEAALAQYVMLYTTHQQIARMYYHRTFVQSQDAFTFMESIYHRVSCIRYLARILAAIAHVEKSENAIGITGDSIFRANMLCVKIFRHSIIGDDKDYLFRRTDLGSSMIRKYFDSSHGHNNIPHETYLFSFKSHYESCHAKEIRGLERAWSRSEAVIRAQFPPEQLLHWCNTLIDDDLRYRFNNVILSYSSTPGEHHTMFCDKQHSAGLNPLAVEPVKSLSGFIENFRVKLNVERSDYKSAIFAREMMLASDNVHLPVDGRYHYPDKIRLVHMHYLIDISVCIIKLDQDSPDNRAKLDRDIQLLDDYQKILQIRFAELDHRPETPQSTVPRESALTHFPLNERSWALSDYHEAMLRIKCLKAEANLSDISVFSRGFDGQTLPSGINLAAAFDAVDAGLQQIRLQDTRKEGPIRNLILEPTVDGESYLQYRSLFHMLRGRTVWMKPLDAASLRTDGDSRGGESPLENAQDATMLAAAHDVSAEQSANYHPVHANQPRLNHINEHFENAFRDFDLARGGLGDSNRLLAGLIELYTVETCLAQARNGLHPFNIAQIDDPILRHQAISAAIDKASAKYETARLALQRAKANLLASRRNVIWWKLFYLLVAQYHADRLLMGYAREIRDNLRERAGTTRGRESHGIFFRRMIQSTVPSNDQRLSDRALFLVRLRRSYSALRSALDYKLPNSAAASDRAPEFGQHDRWLYRIWAEMSLACYSVGMLFLNYSRGLSKYPVNSEQNYLKSILRSVNLSARLLDNQRDMSNPISSLFDPIVPQRKSGSSAPPKPSAADPPPHNKPYFDGCLQIIDQKQHRALTSDTTAVSPLDLRMLLITESDKLACVICPFPPSQPTGDPVSPPSPPPPIQP